MMMDRVPGVMIVTVLFIGSLTACGQLELNVESSPQVEATAPLSQDQQPGSVPKPTEQAVVSAAHPASGLVLSSPAETWYMDSAGKVVMLADQPRAQLASDRQQILVARPDETTGLSDIWLRNLATGEERNLTNTSDRHEELPTWWPAHPELVFFISGVEQGMGSSDNPTVVRLDGEGYRILDPEHGGSFSLAQDGSAIAYGGFESTTWLYRWDAGVEVFDPADYGLYVEKIFQPSFSPDGRYLAWEVSGDLRQDGSSALGLAVIDLDLGTSKLMHVFSLSGGGSFPHYISWSPDGSWIAFVTFGEEPAAGRAPNLWVMRSDGSEETLVDSGLEPTWSPDGGSLAYIRSTTSGELALRIVEAGVWQPVQVDDLPFPAAPDFIMAWITP